MELDCQGEMSIQDPHHSLSKDLHEANPPEVYATPLQDKNQFLPGALTGKRTIAELCLHYGNHPQPLGAVWILFPCPLSKPLAEVFRPHERRAPRAVQA